MKRVFLSLAFALFLVVGLFSCMEKATSNQMFIFKPAPNPTAAAKILGKEISEGELTKGIESDLYDAEVKVYDLKIARLRAILLERLMESDPAKKNMSNDEYLEKVIAKGKLDPSQKQIDEFIKERAIPKEHLNDQMKERVKQFLSMELKKKAVDDWMQAKTAKEPVEVYIKKPQRPVADVKYDGAPMMGGANAKVTVVEFSDFQCPFCAKGSDLLKALKKKYGDKVRFVFKQYPLPFHNDAQGAAEASLCAFEQGDKHFWSFHDHMFTAQDKLQIEELKKIAEKFKLDTKKFNECLDSKKYAGKVAADMEDGKKVGVKSTPTFFVNGQMIQGAQPIEVFSELIDEQLAK